MASLVARTVHVIVSVATLLSGGLEDCVSPADLSCEAGVAAVGAFARNGTGSDPSLVLPFFDKSSPFVLMHPLGFSANRLVMQHVMGWDLFLSTPALLTQHSEDFDVSSRDLSDLQSTEFPFLLSNVGIPPSNSWLPYSTPAYFDEATGLAVVSIVNDNQRFTIEQVEATFGVLKYIERINQRSGCSRQSSTFSLFDTYVNRTSTIRKCWIPIVVYADTKSNFLQWLPPVVEYVYPPALIVNIEEEVEEYSQPIRVQGVWVTSYEADKDVYTQISLDIANGGRQIGDVQLVQRDMEVVPEDLKDATYLENIVRLHEYAQEASSNDPIVGQAVAIPAQRDGTYRRCKAGECEIGNLFNDAARWYSQSDIAFQASGGFRGPGWNAGNVQVSDIWAALPFDNTLCTGVISGVSLFRLFNYSVTYSTFEGENTQLGDRLLQVSGLRISYNLQLKETNRLVKMEIWNDASKNYTEIDRLGLYSFVTDSFTCSGFVEYPELLGEASLVRNGEKPGEIGDDIIIQTIVSDYLAQLESFYDPSSQGGRLVNRTDLTTPLSLVQTPDSCQPGTYWQADVDTCAPCPVESTVTFLSEKLEFEAGEVPVNGVKLINPALYEVEVLPKSMPSWLSIASVVYEATGRESMFNSGAPVVLVPGEPLIIFFELDEGSIEPGTAQGTVVFQVLEDDKFFGCTTRDATFEVFARKYPPQDLNQLGLLRYVGIAMACVAALMSLFLCGWVMKNREIQVVRTLQPLFLGTIAVGVFIMALALVAMSIDDEIASQRTTDVACMSVPWFLSIGFSFAMSALFSKLWRIKRLFRATTYGRRVSVQAKDVLAPIGAMFVINVSIMLVWTLISPLRFQRRTVELEPWNSYAVCRSNDESFGRAMMISVIAINLTCLGLAAYMAYTVRDVSDEFSESKRVGLALFCWVQLVLVAGPMMLLIDEDNLSARYFLETGVIFAVCLSMLCFIFVPIIWLKNAAVLNNSRRTITSSRNGSNSHDVRRTAQQLSKQFTLQQKGPRISGVNFAGEVQSNFDGVTEDPVSSAKIDSIMTTSEQLGVLDEEADSVSSHNKEYGNRV